MQQTYRAKLGLSGPKKLLAIDGGGIRGMIALEFLIAIEDQLRAAQGATPEFVLADYFDYIAGTSTGAIIATAIALGFSARDVRELYRAHGVKMFAASRMRDRLMYRYSAETIKHVLQETLGIGTTLGSDKIRTLLMLVMRNATTDSPWPLSNNPHAKYNDESLADCNLHLPLWQLVRASTAAPVYFPPEVIDIGGKEFVFSDGGITTYNNPAFLLFLMATLEAYKLSWPTGVDRMLLVSIGTGLISSANAKLRPDQMNVLYNAGTIPIALIRAATTEQDMLCRVFGAAQTGSVLDTELGDLANTRGPLAEKLFTYARYDADISREGLDILGLKNIDTRAIEKLDAVSQMDTLSAIGEKSAAIHVRRDHFARFLSSPDGAERPATF